MKKKLVFATNNAHKIEEVRALLAACGPTVADRYEILSLRDIGCHEDIPETADTFSGNALQKAEFVKVHYGYDCFADDSGLEVRALGMEPGVRSARYATDGHDSAANIRKLLNNMERVSDRTAQFRTVIVLLADGGRQDFEGICRGQIRTACSGTDGFGYDPVFQPDDYECTFAEMSMADKNAISHRGQAVRALVEYLTRED
jgi:XTP/dITP diphosphohydrolase